MKHLKNAKIMKEQAFFAMAVLFVLLTLFQTGNTQAQTINIGPNQYAFQYTTNPNFGMFFNATDSRYELRDGTAAPVFHVGAVSGNTYIKGRLGINETNPAAALVVNNGSAHFGIAGGFAKFDEDGDLSFQGNSNYLVYANQYAFRFKQNELYGLYFNSTGTAYQFLSGVDDGSGKGTPLFSINSTSGNIEAAGTAKIGSIPNNNALNQVLVKDASGVVHYRDAATLSGGGGLWTANGSDISYNTGNVGIGTSTPFAELDVRGNMRLGDTANAEQDILFTSSSGEWQVGTNNFGNGANDNQFYIYDNNAFAYRLAVQAGTGNVGIGTTTPISKLTVQTGQGYGLLHTDGAVQVGTYVSSAGGWFGTANDYDLHLFTNNFPPQVTLQSNTGHLGIGTTTPISKLTVQTGQGYGLLHTDGAVQVGTYVSSAGGWFGTANDYDLHLFTNNFPPQVTLQSNTGNLGIGTTTPQSKLAVNGKITCKEVDVTLAGFPDYVFHEDYNLMSLNELSSFIDKNGHLPNMPTEEEVVKNGVGLGALNVKLVEKVEELTLHLIEKDEELNHQRLINEVQEKALMEIQKRLVELEKNNH